MWGVRWSFILLLAGLFPAVSEGIVVKMDNAELVARSEVVVYGTVEEIRSQNHVRVAIIRAHTMLKGGAPTNSRLHVLFSPSISDSPTFTVAERVLLFLRKIESGQFQTVGGFQGKLSLD
jgi:Flp pilus assembly CpaF family ATPase